MDSTVKLIEFVTPKSKYTIFYYKIPVSFGSPHVLKIYPARFLLAYFPPQYRKQ